jgi:hypothetical protein
MEKRRVFDGTAMTFATAGRRRLGRPRLAVSGRRLAVWAVASCLGAVGLAPLAATAADTTVQATATEGLFKLTPSDGTPLAQFGNDVSVSGDTAVVGAPNMHPSAFTGVGAAYVFTRVGDTWTEQAKLTPSDGISGDRFGWSVAISGDTIVVSSMWDDVGAHVDQGSAYVFTRTNGAWTEQAKLTASDGASLEEFGVSVAVSGDDVVVGARTLVENNGVPPQSSAYVFSRSGGRWTEQQKLAASDRVAGDGFGFRVGIDGDIAVVGAPGGDGGHGSAYVFSRAGGTWAQEKELVASNGDADEFGFWVGLDGDTIVVGAPSDDGHGSAYVFTRTAADWTEQERLTASDAAGGDYFGRSVAVSGDRVVVGAQFDQVGDNSNQGSAYVFQRAGEIWSEKAHLIARDGATRDLFGVSVGISGDTAVVGASFANTASAAQGAAYVWRDAAYQNPAGSKAGSPARPSSAHSASAASTDAGRSDGVNGGASRTPEPGAGTGAKRLIGNAVGNHSQPWGILLLVIAVAGVGVRKRLGRVNSNP